MTTEQFSIQAPAKINFTLFVGPRRADGFHYIESLFSAVNLFDQITFEIQTEPGINLTTENQLPFPQPEFDQLSSAPRTNLMVQAYDAAAAWAAKPGTVSRDSTVQGLPGLNVKILPGLNVKITKCIPLGGGLGGGSSNAAALLWFLFTQSPFGQRIDFDQLCTLSLAIGSDVPFFLHYLQAAAANNPAKGAVLFGRGSELHPIQLRRAYGVLAFPGFGVSTGHAYSSLKRPLQSWPQPKSRLDFSNSGPYQAATTEGRRAIISTWPLGSRFTDFENEFEPAVFVQHPLLEEIRQAFLSSGAYLSRMSGSGATMFGLTNTAEQARELLKSMKAWSADEGSGVRFAEFHTL